MRGCTVTATGELFDSLTRYYSASIAVSDAKLKPARSCHPFPVSGDPYAVPIPPDVKVFNASIVVDYYGKGSVNIRVWRGQDKRALLKPWQAYVNYLLAGGGDVIWFGCHKGFRIKSITQIPPDPGGLMDGASDNVGTGLQNMQGKNTITFGCQKI